MAGEFEEWKLLVDSIDDCSVSVELMNFADTGRGLGAVKDIIAGDLLLQVPLRCIVRSRNDDGLHLSPVQSLTYQLIQLKKLYNDSSIDDSAKHNSSACRYLETLPAEYSLPVFIDRSFDRLSNWIKQDFLIQQSRIQNDYKVLKNLIPSLGSELFRWAWSAVNTRCLSLSGASDIALIPLFDMFNHSEFMLKDGLQFTVDSEYFRLFATRSYQRGEQVFIPYGAHDSLFLLREYGFYVPTGSGFDYIQLDDYVHVESMIRDNLKLEMLRNLFFDQDYTVTKDGISWKLMNAMRLHFCGNADEVKKWQQVVAGRCEFISAENEIKVSQAVNDICQRVRDDLLKCVDDPLVSYDFKCILKQLSMVLLSTTFKHAKTSIHS